MTMAEKLAYSINEAAETLSLSRSALKELIYSGQLKHIAVGRRKLVPRWAIDEFLSAENVPSAVPGADWDKVLKNI